MGTNDGGPAFPCFEQKEGWTTLQPIGGMSLRDWYAGMALQGLLARPDHYEWELIDVAASDSYRYADAMLKAREL